MITRFAPSPTGPLHLGHAYSAMLAHDMARAAGGRFLLRIEDTDTQRCRREWEDAIFDDLAWLGLTWEDPVLRQSERTQHYGAAIDRLGARGLVYPCSCSRADIRAALSAPQEGVPVLGPDGLVYPGTCRGRGMDGIQPGDAIRLDAARAVASCDPARLTWHETGPDLPGQRHIDMANFSQTVGDIVLGRRDTGAAAYHLASVVDDGAQGVTHVIRGQDLADAAAIHVLLQALLDLPVPVYHHHHLIRDDAGRRLAKRDDARAIRLYREAGATPQDIRRRIGL